jgi:hypothetical protein
VNGRQDALLAAGLRQCCDCHQADFATAAGWLDERLILASYPRICVHIPAGVVAVCSECVAAQPGEHVHAELLLPGRRCGGRNRYGAPCGAAAVPGSLYCQWHPAGQPGRGGEDGAG